MNKGELIEITKKAIRLDETYFNIINKDDDYGIEININNIIITLVTKVKVPTDKNFISLGYFDDRLSNNGDLVKIYLEQEEISDSVFEELVNLINEKFKRSSDDVFNELKSYIRNNSLDSILN